MEEDVIYVWDYEDEVDDDPLDDLIAECELVDVDMDDLIDHMNTPDICLGTMVHGAIKALDTDDIECQINAYVQYEKLRR